MAYAQGSVVNKTVFGNKRVHYGLFTQESGDTGGSVVTGLRLVEFFTMTGLLTVSVSGGTVTATTTNPGASQTGYWMAIGY